MVSIVISVALKWSLPKRAQNVAVLKGDIKKRGNEFEFDADPFFFRFLRALRRRREERRSILLLIFFFDATSPGTFQRLDVNTDKHNAFVNDFFFQVNFSAHFRESFSDRALEIERRETVFPFSGVLVGDTMDKRHLSASLHSSLLFLRVKHVRSDNERISLRRHISNKITKRLTAVVANNLRRCLLLRFINCLLRAKRIGRVNCLNDSSVSLASL